MRCHSLYLNYLLEWSSVLLGLRRGPEVGREPKRTLGRAGLRASRTPTPEVLSPAGYYSRVKKENDPPSSLLSLDRCRLFPRTGGLGEGCHPF